AEDGIRDDLVTGVQTCALPISLVTLRARGRVGENVTCKIETGNSPVEAGLHPATGGDGSAACSADMLLESLVACAGVTLSAVAKIGRASCREWGEVMGVWGGVR